MKTPTTRLTAANSGKIVLAILCFCSGWKVSPCQAAPFPFVQRTFQSEEGLPGNSVRSVATDSFGMLWVATAEGIVRYNGVKFIPFTAEPEASLSRKSARRLFPLPNGEVWIAVSRNGLLRWDGAHLTEILSETENPFRSITQIVLQPEGGLLIESPTSEPNAKQTHLIWKSDSGLKDHEPSAADKKLIESDRENWKKKGRNMDFFRSRGGNQNSPTAQRMIHEMHDAEGRLWVTSENYQLYMQEGTRAPLQVPLIGLDSGYQVAELAADREGTVWVATNANGLVQFIPSRIQMKSSDQGFTDTAFNGVLMRKDGSLVVAPRKGGLDIHKEGVTKHEDLDLNAPLPFRGLSLLFEDRDQRLWASSRFYYLQYSEHGEWQRYPAPGGGFLRGVRAMAQDENGQIWFGVGSSIQHRFGDEWVTYGTNKGVPSHDVTALTTGLDGTIWAGNSVGDVLMRNPGDAQFITSTHSTTASGRGISMLLSQPDGCVWATTLGAGLLYRDPSGNWHRIHEKQGLPEMRLTSIAVDKKGNLWLGSLDGILQANIGEIKAAASAPDTASTSYLRWGLYDHMDGMLSRECTGGTAAAISTGADGTLYFPTAEGIATLNPNQWNMSKQELDVHFTEMKVNGEEIALPNPLNKSIPQSITVGPGPVRLEASFSAPSMRSGNKVRYRYQMQGFEDTWNNAKTQPEAMFSGLPPGNFVLQVNAATGDGIWRKTPVSLSIKVLAPFWMQWWFRVSCVSFIIVTASLISWLVARRRSNKRLAIVRLEAAREGERSRIARDLHDDLGARLTEITLLAGLGADATQPPEVAKEILDSLENKTRKAVDTLDEIVWAVNPRHDTLASFAEYLSAFAVDLTEAAGKRLRIEVEDLPERNLRSEERHHLFLACREALNNAIKHSGAEAITVGVHLEENNTKLVVDISDNGKGFNSQHFSLSEGLKNLDARLKELHGDCLIHSEIGSGTQVTLTLPLPPLKPTKDL